MSEKRFKVALSFAGENRLYVLKVAECLAKALGRESILYDAWYKAEFTRPNLDTYLQKLYHAETNLLVPFLCVDYENKDWCNLEWRVIKDLIKQRKDDCIMPMRFDDVQIPGLFDTDGFLDLNNHQPEEVADFILQRLQINDLIQPKSVLVQEFNDAVRIDRLPTVAGEFFGRKQELAMLDEALLNGDTRILQFIAAGGTGKTKLLRHWLNHNADQVKNYIVWSFYSQGSAEDKQVSATPFFTEALQALNADRTEFNSEEGKADYLAQLLIHRRCLLVLDGLEPLQHVGKGMDGRLKDRGVAQLLKTLARHHSSLCVITTRILVHDVSDRAHVISHPLDNLEISDGVSLLNSLGVIGPEAELRKAVSEYGYHALALHLLGSALATYLDGDVAKRDQLSKLIDDYNEKGKHAFKVMQAYQHWLTDKNGKATPELQLLYLLSLFDHPIETEVLKVLWRAQIPNLTSQISINEWKVAKHHLDKKHRLLSAHKGRPDLLDSHPLIREYFGRQLRQNQPEAWREASRCLYEYYKAKPTKKLPNTIEKMQPLFLAIAHGCAADLHEEAFIEVYSPRISRGTRNYICQTLGAFSDNLAVLSHFFNKPWKTPVESLQETLKTSLFHLAGFSLQAQGRLKEAQQSFQACLDMCGELEEWEGLARNTNSLCGLQLSLGDVVASLNSGRQSVKFADQYSGSFLQMVCRTAYSDALHQSGDRSGALTFYQEAEKIQRKWEPSYSQLYSHWGFRYCDLLLEMGEVEEVLDRHKQWVKWRIIGDPLFARALEHLTLGSAYYQQGDFKQASAWLNQAVVSLRKAGHLDDLPRGLLARAALYRKTAEFKLAHKDLEEVVDLSERGGMRLFLVDYNLEMSRLLLAQSATFNIENSEAENIFHHISEAERLIDETGYHRRDSELADLKHAL